MADGDGSSRHSRWAEFRRPGEGRSSSKAPRFLYWGKTFRKMGRDSKIESQMMVILCHFPQMMIDDCHFQVPIFSPCVIITKKNDGRWHRLRCVDAELGGFEPPARSSMNL